MPQSNPHRRTRSRLDAQLSSPETQIQESPSRQPNKKRKVQEIINPKMSTEEELRINSVIACLSMPQNEVMVAIDHANDKNARDHRDGVTAYAKLSGQNWTFYVKELRVVIGRPPDSRPNGGEVTPDGDVDIDLGPSKLVSRQHAIIEFDTTGYRSWVLNVMGRNGVKVDEEVHKRGSVVHLKSGNMLEIAGVQMLFFLPDQEATICPSLLERAADLIATEETTHGVLPVANPNANKALKQRIEAFTQVDADHSTHAYPKSTMSDMTYVEMDSSLGHSISTPYSNLKAENYSSGISPKDDKPNAYHRGVMMETIDDIEYAADSAKEIKPPYSYATLIAQAILSSEDEKLTLSQIYAWIMERYAFYRHAATGWQNSIRHNLSLNKAFQKIPRRTDEPGKGMKWQIAEDSRDDFTKKSQKPTPKGGKTSSQASSPASDIKRGQSHAQIKSLANAPILLPPSGDDVQENDPFPLTKDSTRLLPRSTTPPFLSRVTQKEAFTPDRGSRNTAPQSRPSNLDVLTTSHDYNDHINATQDYVQTPSQNRITSSSPYIDEVHDQSMSASAVTPAPQRQHPRLAPPSISQLPSSFLPTSSPAPFWKFMNLSTPARGNEFSSPMKSPMLQSSSPPPIAPLGSRLRDMGSPIKDRDVFKSSQPNKSVVSFAGPEGDEVDDLQGFDLSKGFQSIGKFHANQAAARAQAATNLNGKQLM